MANPVVAKGIADIRDAIARIRAVLPSQAEALAADRTAREVVVLNLFVAIQQCLSLAAHWLAREGVEVPSGYRDVFRALADRSLLEAELASRLAAAAGLRNLITHRYGVLDASRIHELASTRLGDLSGFCEQLARQTPV